MRNRMTTTDKVVVMTIPKQRWFDYQCFAGVEELVNNFNTYADEHKCHLILDLFSEAHTVEELNDLLYEGMYDYIYPEKNIYSAELKAMIERAAEFPRFLGFDVDCVEVITILELMN